MREELHVRMRDMRYEKLRVSASIIKCKSIYKKNIYIHSYIAEQVITTDQKYSAARCNKPEIRKRIDNNKYLNYHTSLRERSNSEPLSNYH